MPSPYPYLAHGDYAIVREPDHPSSPLMVARIFDCDGEKRHFFPNDWTDEQIHHAVHFANKAFSKGYDVGDSDARRQIRAALGIEPK